MELKCEEKKIDTSSLWLLKLNICDFMVFNLYRKSGNLYGNTYTLNSNIYGNSYKSVRKLYNVAVFPYKQNDTCVVARGGV